MAETLPYGAWRSPITSDLIVGEAIGLGDILVDGGDIYWIESRPGESGRNVVVRGLPGGGNEDVTPRPYSARIAGARIWRRQRAGAATARSFSPISSISGFIGRRAARPRSR